MMFTQAINEAFTMEVNKLLAKGMTFYGTMSGHQGEMMKVDVTDGKDVYRVILDRDRDHTDDYKNRFHGDMMVLIVEVFKGEYRNAFDTFHTLWNGKGEQISRKEWYSISDNRYKQVWTEDKAEAMACEKKRYSRYELDDSKAVEIIPANDEQRTLLRDMCRKTKGYKRVKRADIKSLVVRTTSSGTRSYKSYKVFFVENKYKELFIK